MMAWFITEAHQSEVPAELASPFSKFDKVAICIFFHFSLDYFAFNNFSI